MAGGFLLSVPATSANLGPGYDILGLALNLRMMVAATPAAYWSVTVTGHGAAQLPTGADNLIVQAALRGFAALGADPTPYALAVDNPIPVSRGMGSSATAIVTGLALAQVSARGAVERDQLFQEAARMESHPDNVAPAVYGGLCRCWTKDGVFGAEPRPLHPDLSVLLVVPDQTASTAKMRDILPKSYPDAVLAANRRDCDLLLEGLAAGDPAGLRLSEHDRLHQPYRLEAQPVSHAAFKLLAAQPDICGAFLSGSGATVAGWVLGTPPVDAVRDALTRAGIEATVAAVAPDRKGFVWEARRP